MKKIGLLMLALFLLILTACGGRSSTTGSATSEDKKGNDEIVIGLSDFYTGATNYGNAYNRTFREYAAQKGVKTIMLDAQGDAMTQLNQVDNLIQQKVDALVIWPVSAQGIIPGVKKAYDAGIPVLMTNTNIHEDGFKYVKGFAGPNNVLQARYGAEMMIKALGGKGKIVQITGTPGYLTTEERSKEFIRVIEENSDIEILESQNADWATEKAQSVMENFLTKHQEINGVYAQSDNMAAGAINALNEAGRLDGVMVTSSTLFADGYDNIKVGNQYGSVLQDADDDAKIAVDTAIKIAKGEEIEFNNYFDTPIVTQENINEFERPDF